MLSDKDLAKLTNTLEVPLVVQDILDGRETLSADIQYGLHEVLSDYQPDSALLCIALSARKIAAHYQALSPNMAVMKIECDRIIADYADLWLSHAQDHSLDDNLVLDTLEQIPEDLEALAELLDVNIIALRLHDEHIATLCDVLTAQARAQVLIADTFIDLMDQETEATAPDIVENTLPPQAYNDNVIPFPGSRITAN